ncbi:MAG TPA: glycosyltransferase, partial [Alphaproteobacteria bacterium]|nr:glycosyltransferase [Alphaproteobacteria bacterium]
DYPGKFSLVLVDDRSEDGTAAEARKVAAELAADARLELVEGAPLPAGWSGKMWAVEQGVRAAERRAAAAYLLLTDADIVHDPANLRRLVAKAEGDRLDLVSLMVLLRCQSFWERLLVPAFVFFFQMLYPFPQVNRRETRLAAAAGGCMLVRTSALAAAGGIAAIRSAIIDDLALARLIKGRGGAIWLGLTESVTSIRPYDTLGALWHMVARSAYTQLRYSPLLLLGAVAGMATVFVAPPLLVAAALLSGDHPAAALALFAWAGLALMYRPTLALYKEPNWRALLLPLAAAFYMAMTVASAQRHWRGGGGAWKGRSYPRGLSRTS